MDEGNRNSDWREGKTILQCNKYMLENQLHCDVTFLVGEGEERQDMSAHKYMLISRSEVFEAMLSGPLQEHSDHIPLPDVNPTAFKMLLQYMYYDHTKFDEKDIYELLYVSRKYLVTGLIHRCLQRLKTRMSTENVCLILNYADDQGTINLCLAFIFRYPSEVLKSDSFKELTMEHVKTIVSNDRLSVPEEVIFDSVVSWSVQECQRRDIEVLAENQYLVAKDILKLIRYGRLDQNYFKNVCKKFLPQDAYIEVIENLAFESNRITQTSHHSSTRAVVERPAYATNISCSAEARPKEFSNVHVPMEVLDSRSQASIASPVQSVFTRPREQLKIYRFDKHSHAAGKTYDMQTPDSISFITSRDVDLVSVLFYGSCFGEGDYHIHLEVYEDLGGSLSLMHSSERDITTSGLPSPHVLRIEPSIQIVSERVYTITALIQGPPTYFGTNGKPNLRKNGVSVDFITHDELGLNLTTAEGGQFPGLEFEKAM